MGWTSYEKAYCKHKRNGDIDRKAECDYMANREKMYTVVKSAMVGTVYYAAILDNRSNDVFAGIIYTRTDKDYFYYKDMDETVCPYQCKCPKSILKLLTDTDNKLANEWRDNCYKYHESQKDPKLFKNLEEGQYALWTVASDGWNGGIEKGDKYNIVKVRKPSSNRFVWFCDNKGFINPKYINTNEYELVDAPSN